MTRRPLLSALAAVMAAATLSLAPASSALPEAPTHAAASAHAAGAGPTSEARPMLVRDLGRTALHYDSSLTEQQVLQRAEADAGRLGLPLVKTLVAGRVAIVEATPTETAAALASLEGPLPLSGTSAVYLYRGDPHPDSMMVFTGRLLVQFHESVSEAQKRAFLEAQGFTRLRENAAGSVFVETGLTPGSHMMQAAAMLKQQAEWVAEANFEFLSTAELTSINSSSIAIDDDLFQYQWYHFNAASNTNFQAGRPDQDIDTPRAWQINQVNRNAFPGQMARGVFGHPSIVVGLFDNGVQINHEDLAENIDPRLGIDFVDSGAPLPILSPLGAHGTAMAGLIAGSRNDRGIVGVAPDTTIYPVRVVRPDNSVSNVVLLQALQDSIFKGVDVNVHPYVVPFDVQDSLATATEQGFRETIESGRAGIGITNIAAAGNFWSQVEYPGHSRYTISVGGHDSSGENTFQANWGGVGVDITMPTYAIGQGGGIDSLATGIVTTDLQGSAGLSGPDTFTPGMEAGNYAVIGHVDGLASSSSQIANFYLGTSVSTALAGGVVALMLADERYHELPPLELTDGLTRQQTRDRAPVWPEDSTIYSKLVRYADLPGVATSLAYIDQYNERLGHGRPNPARFLAAASVAPGGPDGLPTADSGFLGQLDPTPVYLAQFAFEAPLDYLNVEPADPDDPESVAEAEAIIEARTFELSQGWAPDPNANISAFLGDDFGTQIISPALVPVGQLWVEGEDSPREPAPPEPTEEEPNPPPNFFWVWQDSLPFQTDDSDDLDVATNLVHNPEGRYQRNSTFRLRSPVFPYAGEPTPMVLTVRVAHELGVQGASEFPANIPIGNPTSVVNSIDQIRAEVFYVSEEGGTDIVPVGTLTGDSSSRRKTRLIPATVIDIGDQTVIRRPSWPAGNAWGQQYNPFLPSEEMIIREYRFFVPGPLPDETQLRIGLTLQSGSAYLPSWRPVEENNVLRAQQIYNIFRNYPGYILESVELHRFSSSYMDYLSKRNYDLANGTLPVWSASQNDVLLIQPFDMDDFHVSTMLVADPRPEYVTNRDSLATTFRRPEIRLMESFDRITGFSSNPLIEMILVTTHGPGGDNISLVTTDGAMQQPIIDPGLAVGARDPSWAINGRQVLYSSEDYIRLLNLTSDGIVPETVISANHPFLTDFRNPTFDRDSSIVFFTARRTDGAPDTSLNLYVTTRAGRVISFREDSRLPFLAGWDNIDIYDLELSTSGRRLFFVANASEPPEFDGLDPYNVIIPAQPSSGNTIFMIENFNNVLRYGDQPVYEKLALSPEDPAYTASARWPRLSPNRQEVVYAAYTDPVNINQAPRNGRIVRQPVSPETNIPPINIEPVEPAPDVTPAPEPTPAPVDEGRVLFSGSYNFLDTRQGWNFGSAQPILDAPIGVHNAVEGALTMRSNGSLNTFGFWESAPTAIQALEGSLYLYRANVRTTPNTAAEVAPTTRLRVNSTNLENVFLAETNSGGDLSLVPGPDSTKAMDLLFRPSRDVFSTGVIDARRYRLAFDLVNFLPDNSPDGGLMLDGVELYRLDEQSKHYALFCFEVQVPNTNVSLTALGASQTAGTIDMSVRRCCNDPQSEEACTTGSARDGVTLNLTGLSAGFYTVVVAVDHEQEVFLSWDASSPLAPNCDDGSCSPVKSDFDDSRDACQVRAAIGGTSGAVGRATFHDGTGFFPPPACAANPNRSVVKAREIFFQQDFEDAEASDIWFSGPEGSPYALPAFDRAADGLTFSVTDPTNTFGFWSTDGTTIPSGLEGLEDPEGPVIYRATFRISNDGETDPLRMPDIRLRLGTNDNQRSVTGQLISNLDGFTTPLPGRPREVELYMVLEEVPTSFSGLIAAVDVVAFFEDRNVTASPIKFESIRIERLDIPNYPAPR